MSEEIEGSVDVDEFFDGAEVPEADATVEVEEIGEEFTEKPGTETETEEKPNVSITDLLADTDESVRDEQDDKPHGSGFVPEADHIKLRKRAQAAEAELERLKSQPTRTDAENSGTEIDDDDLVTGKDISNLAAKLEAKADAKAEVRYKERQAKDLIAAKSTKAEADQDVIAAERSDYYDVIGAMQNLQLSPKAIAEIKNADNVAEKAYEIGCSILNRKPAQKRTPTNTPTNETETNAGKTDEEALFDEIFDS